MLHVNYTINYGVVKVRSDVDGKLYKVDIHPANALCAFIYHYKNEKGTKMARLWNFINDKQHIKNIMKEFGNLLGDEVESVKLNLFYKEAQALVEPMAKSGYKVEVYYEEKK